MMIGATEGEQQRGFDMKKYVMLLGLFLVGLSDSSAHFMPHGRVGVSFEVFYSSLSPYGEWIAIDHGVYAWRPLDVRQDWRPYTVGRWVWTDDGWYWLSDEPWGWASYHYGRWYFDDFYGWVWIPGYEWAPAWVEWRYGGDYIGWAPLGPYALFSINVGITYRTRWVTPHYYWSFIHCRYITHSHVNRYVYRTANNTRYIGRTRSAGNVRYVGGRVVSRGPERSYVERRGNVRVAHMDIADTDQRREGVTRIQGRDRIEVYRPRIEVKAEGVDRPSRVREGERRVSIDIKDIDVRSRRVDQERTDVNRTETQIERAPDRRADVRPEIKTEDNNTRAPQPNRIERRMDTAPERNDPATRRETRQEKQIERRVEPNDRSDVKRSSAPSRRPEVNEGRRSSTPERTIRRGESRKEEKRSDSAPKREGRKR